MYNWRKMTPQQKSEILEYRRLMRFPLHQTPTVHQGGLFHISVACFEHQHYIGFTPDRMADFSKRLIETLLENNGGLYAWAALPNHYHLLVKTNDLGLFKIELGKLHSKTSREWNLQENATGRRVWYRSSDGRIRNERHYWSTINYINNNAVHHNYVSRWQDWPFSSAIEYINLYGIEQAKSIWKEYPVLNYGKGWDDAHK